MTNLLRAGWTRLWEHALPVLAAVVLYGGTQQIVSAARYPLVGVIISGINAIIRQGFRDAQPLPNGYLEVSWQYHARNVSAGVAMLIAGLLLGLWANVRSNRQPVL